MSYNYFVDNLSQELRDTILLRCGLEGAIAPFTIDDIVLLKLEHYNFDGSVEQGEILVLNKIAQSVIHIFQELFVAKFPIAKMKLIHHYNWDDNLSMIDNNTSCFNYRVILNSTKLSMHSYGLAIDINPVQNPCIVLENATQHIMPSEGKAYLNRNDYRPGMVEPIIYIFEKYGFSWGGNWSDPIDYHHFQINREDIFGK